MERSNKKNLDYTCESLWTSTLEVCVYSKSTYNFIIARDAFEAYLSTLSRTQHGGAQCPTNRKLRYIKLSESHKFLNKKKLLSISFSFFISNDPFVDHDTNSMSLSLSLSFARSFLMFSYVGSAIEFFSSTFLFFHMHDIVRGGGAMLSKEEIFSFQIRSKQNAHQA